MYSTEKITNGTHVCNQLSDQETLSIPRNPYHALSVTGFPNPSARGLLC